MKYFFVAALLFVGFKDYSQTAIKAKPYSAESLSMYMWSFSKNSSKPVKKSLIDFNAIENWRVLGDYLAVNVDGKYFSYTINKPTGTRYWFRRLDSLVVQSTRNRWRFAFAGCNPGFFTANGERYVFQKGDTLCFLQLGKSERRNVKDV